MGNIITATNLGNAPKWAQDKTIVVHPTFPEIAGYRYQTIVAANTYAKAQTPSSSNRWVIIVMGNNSENFSVARYVSIVGHASGTMLTGEINSEGQWAAGLNEYTIENCIVSDIKTTVNKSLLLLGCLVTASTPASGKLLLVNSVILGGAIDLSSLQTLQMINSFYYGWIGSLTLPSGCSAINSAFDGLIETTVLNGGTFTNCAFGSAGGTVAVNAGTYTMVNCYVRNWTNIAGVTLTVRKSFINSFTLTDGTVNSYASSYGSSTISGGTWNEYNKMNVIQELTSAAGVTIDSVLCKDGDISIATGKALIVDSIQVVSDQQAHIANPAGGGVVDAEARTAIDSILVALETHGLVASS